VAAARRLIDLESEPGDPQIVAAALGLIAKAAPDLTDRKEAATQLLSLRARGGDGQAAEELVEIYAGAGDWTKLPEALRALVGSGEDLGRAVLLLLRLEESAVQAPAVNEFVSLVDELVIRLGRDSPEQIRALTRARARALRADPAQHQEASNAYRSLIETFGSDEDARDFASFVDSRPNAEERHRDRRWLYRWRAAQVPRSGEVLIEWAKAEEEHGDTQAAIAIYERLAEMDSGRKVAFEALRRLSAQSGDDRLARLLRAAVPKATPGGERSGLRGILAGVLLEQASRLDEAIAVLSSAIDEEPHGRAASQAAAGTFEEAAKAYRKLLLVAERTSSPEELVRIAVATADACARAGGLAEAREALGRVAEVLSHNPGLAPDLERLCRAIGDWKRLASTLTTQAAQENDVDRKTGLLLRAGQLLLEAASDPASALRVIDLARDASPQNIEAIVLWARAQLALGQTKQALDALYDAAQRSDGTSSPRLATIYLEIGRAHLAVDEIVEAFGALELGFGADPRAGDIAMLFGLVALDVDEESAAERAFTAVTRLPPRAGGSGPGAESARSIALYRLGSLALKRGDLAKARELASSAVDTDPSHRAARALLEMVDSAS
jgi:tetratricopeptide (TPR) repeat protein